MTTFDPTDSTEKILAGMERDGAAIVRDMVKPDAVAAMLEEVAPFVDATPKGSDDFTGRRTQRTGALVARTPRCRAFVTDERVLAAARGFLEPFTERIVLHLTQTINIHPGQGAQYLHRDRLAWGTHLPPSVEPQFNTIWALTDFTRENGATQVVPGSQKWDVKRRANPDEVCQAEMSAGSVLLYTGSVIHGGGENRADAARTGLNITYCLGWLRQEENQYLSCPPRIARTLEPDLQELLGYTMGNYALGYFSDTDATEHTGILPPEAALGRRPREGSSFTGLDD